MDAGISTEPLPFPRLLFPSSATLFERTMALPEDTATPPAPVAPPAPVMLAAPNGPFSPEQMAWLQTRLPHPLTPTWLGPCTSAADPPTSAAPLGESSVCVSYDARYCHTQPVEVRFLPRSPPDRCPRRRGEPAGARTRGDAPSRAECGHCMCYAVCIGLMSVSCPSLSAGSSRTMLGVLPPPSDLPTLPTFIPTGGSVAGIDILAATVLSHTGTQAMQPIVAAPLSGPQQWSLHNCMLLAHTTRPQHFLQRW